MYAHEWAGERMSSRLTAGPGGGVLLEQARTTRQPTTAATGDLI
jgi:hypothetical protein